MQLKKTKRFSKNRSTRSSDNPGKTNEMINVRRIPLTPYGRSLITPSLKTREFSDRMTCGQCFVSKKLYINCQIISVLARDTVRQSETKINFDKKIFTSSI